MNKVEWISVSDILPVDEGDVLVLRNGLNGWDITVYDRTTKVQYAVSDGYYNMGTITCLVDAEGKPLLYND